ncbi:hypothetical protein J4477_00175 [Candidatus Pacearchaeota archaeon]|nr:hypothetical protein [Candidatus Pacearchaeota archaeon]
MGKYDDFNSDVLKKHRKQELEWRQEDVQKYLENLPTTRENIHKLAGKPLKEEEDANTRVAKFLAAAKKSLDERDKENPSHAISYALDGFKYAADLASKTENPSRIYRLLDKQVYKTVKLSKEVESDSLLRKGIDFGQRIEGELKKIGREQHGSIEYHIVGIAGAFGLLASLFFLSTNLTGNVIGNLSRTGANWVGGILFVLGLAGVFAFGKLNS